MSVPGSRLDSLIFALSRAYEINPNFKFGIDFLTLPHNIEPRLLLTLRDDLLNAERSLQDCNQKINALHLTDSNIELLEQAGNSLISLTRIQAYRPILEKQIIELQDKITNGDEKIDGLRRRITAQKGKKTKLKKTKDSLTKNKTKLFEKVKTLYAEREEFNKLETSLDLSVKTRFIAMKRQKVIDPKILRIYRQAMLKKEKTKAYFLTVNGHPELMVDNKVQKAFDRILKSSIENPPSFWDWICCCIPLM